MSMYIDWYHQHRYRRSGMGYSNTHRYLKINKKFKGERVYNDHMQVGCIEGGFQPQNRCLSSENKHDIKGEAAFNDHDV